MRNGVDTEPVFPPLLSGEEAPPGTDPFDKAVAAALIDCDSGHIVWSRRPDRMTAAIVLAPEAPLAEAISIVFAVSLGFGDALGALGPPELAVHYSWPDGILVNGAQAGILRAATATDDVDTPPDWLVVGLDIALMPEGEGGDDPSQTCLYAEGCAEIPPVTLLESWSRHMLVWINTWLEDGLAPLHAAWRERAWGMGEDLPDGSGLFVGLDEWGGQLVKTDATTLVRPLTKLVERS
ncbi:MAG: biotin/lipoate--protein ligase family protein [Pseudomonadota bacterium]